MPSTPSLTAGDILEFIAPGLWRKFDLLLWPPDTFAAVTAILHRSGGYTAVLDDWPPAAGLGLAPSADAQDRLGAWAKMIKGVGAAWGEAAGLVYFANEGNLHCEGFVSFLRAPNFAPAWLTRLKRWWRVVLAHKHQAVFDIPDSSPFFLALLQLSAAADEACFGVGQPEPTTAMQTAASDYLEVVLAPPDSPEGSARLRAPATLCWQIHPSRGSVLPKLHTPQSGLTVRALSHHLAFCSASEVSPLWFVNNFSIPEHSINLLAVPWPAEVSPSQFSACAEDQLGFALAEPYGHFTFAPRLPENWQNRLRALLRSALHQTSHIDGVVLPELALPTEAEYGELVGIVLDTLREWHRAWRATETEIFSLFIVAGVGSAPGADGRAVKNKAICSLHVWDRERHDWISPEWMKNSKQHSWRLTDSQICNYALGRQLDIRKSWWEHNRLGRRDVTFIAWATWLTLCTVICEDLARPDPLTEVIRAVGPNLVIALLMDGPQLPHRWSGRHAVVLADDPGSAVLTLTSIGMVERSTPPDRPASRVVGLWKDPRHGVTEIVLPVGAEAVVLTLARERTQEWTADGRGDAESAAHLILCGVLPLRGETPPPPPPAPPSGRWRLPLRRR